MKDGEPAGSGASITRLLRAWEEGSREAESVLLNRAYPELRRIAARHLAGEKPNISIQSTDLVNEAYLRIAGTKPRFRDRVHFYAVASTTMRRILVDRARSQRTVKRTGLRVSLDQASPSTSSRSVDVLALDDALKILEQRHPFEALLVHLRYFCGLTIPETAECLGVGHATVERSWRVARTLVRRYMQLR